MPPVDTHPESRLRSGRHVPNLADRKVPKAKTIGTEAKWREPKVYCFGCHVERLVINPYP